MFALTVELQHREQGMAKELASDALVPPDPGQNGLEDLQDTISVSAGNPRVEHTTGVVHLYRELDDEVIDHSTRSNLPVRDHATPFCSWIVCHEASVQGQG